MLSFFNKKENAIDCKVNKDKVLHKLKSLIDNQITAHPPSFLHSAEQLNTFLPE